MALHRLKKLKKIVKEEKAEIVPLFSAPSETLSEPQREPITPEPAPPPSQEEILALLKQDEEFLEKLAQAADGKRIMGGEGAPKFPSPVKYQAIEGPTYTIDKTYLIPGINIFGVQGSVDTTVYLPLRLPNNKLIYVNNEMESNTVTVQSIAY